MFQKPYKTQYLRMLLRSKGIKRRWSVVKHALKGNGSILTAPHPLYVKLEINRTCNCKCVECVRLTLDNRHQVMDFATYKLILDHLDPIIELMPYGFGEPLLHPQFFEFMEYANKKKLRISLVSNFTLMTEEMAHKVLDLKPASIRVSMDGVGKRFEEIRIGAKFEKVLKNVRRFKEIADDRHQKIDFWINATIWRENLDQIIPLTYLAMDIGVPICFTNISTACGDFKCVTENCIGSNEDLLVQTQHLMDRATRLYDKVVYGIQQPVIRTCQRQWDSVYVDYKGDVFTCTNNIREPDDILGNVIRDDISKIFNGEKYQRMRARSYLGDESLSCPTCMAWAPRMPRTPTDTPEELYEHMESYYLENKLSKTF